ncbi:lysylphosphatidylglycerol synthase domain-containing protein [Cochleicola gelatinilyticus]|uniref:lysylphosphatidylglycerol synthase domain-containing protein n=1 Tax=Cochleicola gelatinilyticus TaxID=1763537 RepID=UPI0008398C82|nr:lysylphosphatidylglycerol synthase domain-containing protein [Cochleicola gelatinilyticus]
MQPSHKSKQYLFVALKVFILTITFGYIYYKVTHSETLRFSDFVQFIASKQHVLRSFCLFVLLAALNWFFEILKWKTIASVVRHIPFKTALKQSLASLTVSLATPNRIGEYGAKAYFFPKKDRKKILLLTFFSNGMQLTATGCFGGIGLAYLLNKQVLTFSILNTLLFLVIFVLLVVFGYLFKERDFLTKGLSIVNVTAYIKQLPTNVTLKTILFSLIRYTLFSSLFLLTLWFFGAVISWQEGMCLIFAMYLFVSAIPTLFVLDVVVRGGVAVWLFSLAGVSEIIVLSTVLLMWLLNFVIPAVWGSLYVATYTLEKE